MLIILQSPKKKLQEHFLTCLHCKEPVYYDYIVKTEIWEEAGLAYHDGVLHLPCLEQLLNRELSLNDFNFEIRSGEKHNINDALKWAWTKK